MVTYMCRGIDTVFRYLRPKKQSWPWEAIEKGEALFVTGALYSCKATEQSFRPHAFQSVRSAGRRWAPILCMHGALYLHCWYILVNIPLWWISAMSSLTSIIILGIFLHIASTVNQGNALAVMWSLHFTRNIKIEPRTAQTPCLAWLGLAGIARRKWPDLTDSLSGVVSLERW